MRISRSYNQDLMKIHNYRIVPCFCKKDPKQNPRNAIESSSAA